MTVLLAAGCYLAYGFGRLWAEWRRVSQPVDVRQATEAELAPPAIVLPLAGHWSFADLDWKLRSNIVDKEDVATRFESLTAQAAHQSTDQLPDVSPQIMDLIEKLQLQPVEREENLIYRLKRLGLRAQLVVRIVAGRPKAVSLAAAYPQQRDRWQLLELAPRGASSSSPGPRPFLLPLPAGAARAGGRFADDGSALLELITLNSTSGDLFSNWKGAGWDVRPMGLGGRDEFRYLCVRGDEVIYAWSADEPSAMQSLMLVRTPNNTDTSP
jgi:hypothetical protein